MEPADRKKMWAMLHAQTEEDMRRIQEEGTEAAITSDKIAELRAVRDRMMANAKAAAG